MELGTLLCRLDPAGLSGYWLVEYTGAVQRQKAMLDARMAYAAHELGYCLPELERADNDDDEDGQNGSVVRLLLRHGDNVAELEARLGWGRGRAGAFDNHGNLLRDEFVDTWVMLHAGEIDLEVARAVAEGACCLDDQKNRATVEARVLAWIRKLLTRNADDTGDSNEDTGGSDGAGGSDPPPY